MILLYQILQNAQIKKGGWVGVKRATAGKTPQAELKIRKRFSMSKAVAAIFSVGVAVAGTKPQAQARRSEIRKAV